MLALKRNNTWLTANNQIQAMQIQAIMMQSSFVTKPVWRMALCNACNHHTPAIDEHTCLPASR